MNAIGTPTFFPEIFAANAGSLIRPIPQTSVSPVAASLDLGFPPATATPVGGGGTPPDIRDFNGMFNQLCAWAQWGSAGAPNIYNSTFASAISGYPKGAVLSSAKYNGVLWRNTVDGNSTDPDNPAVAANWARLGRIPLLGNTTFYVNASTGNDVSGAGLTTGTAYRTLPFAISDVQQLYDAGGNSVTVQLADNASSYGDVVISGPMPGLTQPTNFIIQGNTGTPSNTKVGNILFQNGAMGTPQGVYMAGNYGLSASAFGNAFLGTNVIFGPMASYQVDCRANGLITLSNSYSIAGGAASHLSVQGKGTIILSGATGTLTGTPSFGAFALLNAQAFMQIASSSYSGSATGQRYSLNQQSQVTGAGSATFFPGNSGGITDSTSLYN